MTSKYRPCAGLECYVGVLTGQGCPGNGPCPLATLAEQGVIMLGHGLIAPVQMILHCPGCGERHIDRGDFAEKAHHTHACQSCGFVWRPAKVPTVGVQFLPGFKDEEQ